MAENKKSFILYADIINVVKRLPKEIQADLFMTILEYVNDLTPTISDNLLLEIAFEPIKLQLKRDLIRWDAFREKQAGNGKLGGRPKKPKPKKENPKNPSLLPETQKSLTVTVTDTVTDTVIATVTANEIKIPTEVDFLEYCKTIKNINYSEYEFSFKTKYESWVADGWKDGHGKPIKNWKSKIKNCIPFFKPMKQNSTPYPKSQIYDRIE